VDFHHGAARPARLRSRQDKKAEYQGETEAKETWHLQEGYDDNEHDYSIHIRLQQLRAIQLYR